ncbi:MAG: hypothetical protein AB1568_00200 [Thermodesulfobacteriota bacterium]
MKIEEFLKRVSEASNAVGAETVKLFFNIDENCNIVLVSGNKIEVTLPAKKEDAD